MGQVKVSTKKVSRGHFWDTFWFLARALGLDFFSQGRDRGVVPAVLQWAGTASLAGRTLQRMCHVDAAAWPPPLRRRTQRQPIRRCPPQRPTYVACARGKEGARQRQGLQHQRKGW
jgi:hypothetical protein